MKYFQYFNGAAQRVCLCAILQVMGSWKIRNVKQRQPDWDWTFQNINLIYKLKPGLKYPSARLVLSAS